VPVILIFTKFESREATTFKMLKQECSDEEALARTPQEAQNQFNREHLSRFMDRKYAPKEILYIKGQCLHTCLSILLATNIVSDMNQDGAKCPEIVELTMKALNSDTLKWLLVTVQQTNLKLCIQQMFRRYRASLNMMIS
jgi:hypothetical protein